MKWKHHGYLLAHQIVATQELHIHCVNSQNLTFCGFFLELNLKNPCTNMDPNLFLQKCKQQYWDKPNEVKLPWLLVGAAGSKHIKSAYRTAWTFIWPLMCISFKKMFRKLLKILNQQEPNFFLFVLLELWFVYHFPCFFLQFFDVGTQS